MALVVEDGTGMSDAESYVSVSDADSWHTKHQAPATWTAASTAEKEAALRQATHYLDIRFTGRWRGYKGSSTQALAWPRAFGIDDEGYPIDDDSLPVLLEGATAELASKVIDGDTLLVDVTKPGQIKRKSIKAGPISKDVEYMGGLSPQKEYTEVEKMLVPLLESTNKLERG